jgi:outer membrane protein assembly factor BamE (lipoprotein component of BamABCDE complex)
MKYCLLIVLTSFFLTGCVTPPEPLSKQNSSLTQGNVQPPLKVGITDKSEVLNIFSAPHITTRYPSITTRYPSGQEVWSTKGLGKRQKLHLRRVDGR